MVSANYVPVKEQRIQHLCLVALLFFIKKNLGKNIPFEFQMQKFGFVVCICIFLNSYFLQTWPAHYCQRHFMFFENNCKKRYCSRANTLICFDQTLKTGSGNRILGSVNRTFLVLVWGPS